MKTVAPVGRRVCVTVCSEDTEPAGSGNSKMKTLVGS